MNWITQNASSMERAKLAFPNTISWLNAIAHTKKSTILLLLDERNAQDYWIILKTRGTWTEHVIENFIYEIAFLAYLWKKFPQFRNQIPRLYWIVRDSQEWIMGIVMEKFPWDEPTRYCQIGLLSFYDEEIIHELRENWFDDELLNSLEFSLFKWWNWNALVKKIWDTEDIWRELAKDNNKTKVRRLLKRYARLLLQHPELYTIAIETR